MSRKGHKMIEVQEECWEKLMMLKIKKNKKTINDVIVEMMENNKI